MSHKYAFLQHIIGWDDPDIIPKMRWHVQQQKVFIQNVQVNSKIHDFNPKYLTESGMTRKNKNVVYGWANLVSPKLENHLSLAGVCFVWKRQTEPRAVVIKTWGDPFVYWMMLLRTKLKMYWNLRAHKKRLISRTVQAGSGPVLFLILFSMTCWRANQTGHCHIPYGCVCSVVWARMELEPTTERFLIYLLN